MHLRDLWAGHPDRAIQLPLTAVRPSALTATPSTMPV